ncbi:MAG: biotin-dependent carboxyltransferase family protein [Acidobacteria bacterium]|nr:biotin-dependent carboxyltransferase family protein [Acidobacteriota bacterium]MCA1609045.1 biotin-dependent carboxyltransferase family protein [Acidobacteriota bacterium]
MSLLFDKPGILTTVQDMGRFGHRRFGINPGGVMDRAAARLLNILLGNNQNEAVIEMHFPAAEIVFGGETPFAIGGADFVPTLNGETIRNWTSQIARKGDRLKFTHSLRGSRAYFAVAGGFETRIWLDSSSTHLVAGRGGFEGRQIRSGDRLKTRISGKSKSSLNPRSVSRTLTSPYSRFPTIRIVRGPEYNNLTALGRETLHVGNFSISKDSNRMGLRLSGPKLSSFEDSGIISSGVTPGTIQLLPDGQLIVLAADCQTTGGYPRIANIISTDLSLIAQLLPGDQMHFKLVSQADAEQSALDLEREIAFLKLGVRLTAV